MDCCACRVSRLADNLAALKNGELHWTGLSLVRYICANNTLADSKLMIHNRRCARMNRSILTIPHSPGAPHCSRFWMRFTPARGSQAGIIKRMLCIQSEYTHLPLEQCMLHTWTRRGHAYSRAAKWSSACKSSQTPIPMKYAGQCRVNDRICSAA